MNKRSILQEVYEADYDLVFLEDIYDEAILGVIENMEIGDPLKLEYDVKAKVAYSKAKMLYLSIAHYEAKSEHEAMDALSYNEWRLPDYIFVEDIILASFA